MNLPLEALGGIVTYTWTGQTAFVSREWKLATEWAQFEKNTGS